MLIPCRASLSPLPNYPAVLAGHGLAPTYHYDTNSLRSINWYALTHSQLNICNKVVLTLCAGVDEASRNVCAFSPEEPGGDK